MDLASRKWKAEKILRLLGLGDAPGPIRLLEIGTGSGGIANYFGAHAGGRFLVDAVDVVDNRMVDDGYRFTLVSDTTLPFADASFDVVLSNHVIEHVGDESQQRKHLAEVHRVLRPGGAGYLAVPNRWMLTEPHYRLAFLSWLPRRWRSPYLRLAGRGDFYDCEPLQMGQLEQFFREGGFRCRNRGVEALRATFEIERAHSRATRWLRHVPDGLLEPFRRLIPTHIYTFEHAS
jgi:SAM-dependent methyltransferase